MFTALGELVSSLHGFEQGNVNVARYRTSWSKKVPDLSFTTDLSLAHATC